MYRDQILGLRLGVQMTVPKLPMKTLVNTCVSISSSNRIAPLLDPVSSSDDSVIGWSCCPLVELNNKIGHITTTKNHGCYFA